MRPGQPFFDTVSQLVDLAIAANDKGNYFPVRASKANGSTRQQVAQQGAANGRGREMRRGAASGSRWRSKG